MTYRSLTRDTIWNLAGLGAVAAGGVTMQVLVGRHYGPDGLGVFNQVLAVFLFASQIAVFGVHLSALQKVSVAAADYDRPDGRARCRATLTTAMLATMVAALPTTLIGYLAAPLIGRIFNSPDVVTGWLAILPALPLMACNKVLLNTVNALHCMRAYAILSTSRYVLIVAFIAAAIAAGAPAALMPLSLSGAEAVLLLLCAGYLMPRLPPLLGHDWPVAVRGHLRFGGLGLIGGAVSELNTKTDIVVLGAFASDKIVGIYSIASLIFEGLALVPQVLRNIANPLIARFLAAGDWRAFSGALRQIRVAATLLTALGAAAVCLLYGPFVELALANPGFLEALPALLILMAGLVISAPWAPLDMLFSQASRPFAQSLFKGGVFAVNLVLNIVLVPFYGLIGAAIATACAQIAGVLLIKVMARRLLSLKV